MIKAIRLQSQQLIHPSFDNPKELVQWMGAIQAQDYTMVKWALGVRLKNGTNKTIGDSLDKGEILRTHIMRPTWHLVAAEDIRWMLMLTGERLKSANDSLAKYLDMPPELYLKCNRLIEKILEGKNLTRQEIGIELERTGIDIDSSRIHRFMMQAEAKGLICSGIDKAKKPTYALLEERVAPVKELHREEALAKLAIRYFQSHSPATLQDFVWWSGLSITESRQAIGLIDSQLITDKFASQNFFVHQSYNIDKKVDDTLHLLPPYDEYLISYKDRTDVLNLEYYPKAFTKYGIFYPVIVYNGKVVGNWKKTMKKGMPEIETSFFDKGINIDNELIAKAKKEYIAFL